MSKEIIVSDEVYKKFQAGLMLSGEDESMVVERLLANYAKSAFENELGVADQNDNVIQDPAIDRVRQKIATWATKEEQMNHRIIQSFFMCEQNGIANKDSMRHFFVNAGYGNEWQFDNNFASLCTNEGQANGKVFESVGILINIASDVEDTLRFYKEDFMRNKPKNYSEVQKAAVTVNDEKMQKQRFMTWFSTLTRNGKPYNPVTISGYTGRIENACADEVFSSVPVDNLFKITILKEFLDVKAMLKRCAGYMEFDAKSHNGFTAALNKYEGFLRYQENSTGEEQVEIVRSYTASKAPVHRWTFEEDEICCRKFIETYVVAQSDKDITVFLKELSRLVPDVSEGSLRMKIQNVRCLSNEYGLKDTAAIKWLSQYSVQCKEAFESVAKELNLFDVEGK